MSTRSLGLRPAALPLAAMLLLAASVPAAAQRTGEPIFEIVVVAPRLVRQEVGRTASGGRTELVSLTRRVSYEDLDLKLHANVLELEKRVSDVAKQACEQLASLYPLSDPSTPDCVADAVDKAMAQVREAAAAAAR